MDTIATSTVEERADLFRATADRMDFHPVNVEKDFWVCWLLKHLFSIPELDGWLTFKGGTSLSKCFNLIPRFSEDIDLAVDFERLGFTGERDPRRTDLSYTKLQPILDEMLDACRKFIAGHFMGALSNRISEVFGSDGWKLEVSPDDANTIEFEYPSSLDVQLDYIRPRHRAGRQCRTTRQRLLAGRIVRFGFAEETSTWINDQLPSCIPDNP